MFSSHYCAGTGAVLVSTREEGRLIRDILAEFPDAPVCTVAAPTGPVRNARTGCAEGAPGLAPALQWAQGAPGRILVVYDYHVLVNNPGHWRGLAEAIPGLRCPRGSKDDPRPSLAVFVGPSWELTPQNPLRGLLPILSLAPPGREALRAAAERIGPLNGNAELVVDALCGLDEDSAEQACAENFAKTGGRYDPETLRGKRKQSLREAGLEIWPGVETVGGLSGIQNFLESELIPWIRDEQLCIRRVLCAGVFGVGKSFLARRLAHRLGCECARLSIPSLKAGTVGASEGNLRRALGTLDSLGRHAPVVAVIDEIDTIAREGLDGGTSAGMFAELLTWLQESTSQVIVWATLNHLSKLDAALESRFQARFFFDLPSHAERASVAEIHYRRLGCPLDAVRVTADCTDGFSSREIAEHVIPSIARLTQRKPDAQTVSQVCGAYTPVSQTQGEQLQQMRRAAGSLRRANDPDDSAAPSGVRRVKTS